MSEAVTTPSRLPWTVVLLTVVFVLAGCGPARPAVGADTGQGWVAPSDRGDPAAVLAGWTTFPAAADPRPLVLTGPSVVDPQRGFPDGQSKLAYVEGKFDLAVALPSGPPSSDGYPIVSARAALDRFSTGKPAKAAYGLRVVTASLGHARFGTDRGPLLLPAWRFGLEKVADPVWVLAVQPKGLWPAKPSPGTASESTATQQADGRSLSYRFLGGPAGPPPCGSEYAAEATESSTAVVVSIRTVTQQPTGSGSSSVACAAVGAYRTVAVRLAAPLGGRVLLTPDGAPVPVTNR